MNVRVVVSLRSLALSHSFLAHIAWLKMSECLCHLIHALSERFFWPSSSPSFSFSHSSSTSSSSCYPSTSPRISCNTVYSAFRRCVYGRIHSHTDCKSWWMLLGGALSRRRLRRPSRTRWEHRDAWTKSGQEGRDEWSKLKLCPEDPDAWDSVKQKIPALSWSEWEPNGSQPQGEVSFLLLNSMHN